VNASSVSLVGNLVAAPEVRYASTGRAMARLRIACNRSWQKDGEWQEETSFFDVDLFGELAENVAESVTKGDRITVEGRLQQQSWEKDGEKQYRVVVVADEVGASLRFATAKVVRSVRTNNVTTLAAAAAG